MKNKYIVEAQQLLKEAGMYHLKVDGSFGKGTLEAVINTLKLTGFVPEEKPEGYITKNFKLDEFLVSDTANRLGISNTPLAKHRQNLEESAINLWQPARDLLNQPMIIGSGYRNPTVNKAVGGVSNSAHSLGYAIDFRAPKFGTTIEIAKFLVEEFKKNNIKFDQIILEFPNEASTWVHLAYKNRSGQQRNQVLTATGRQGKKVIYQSGLVY